LRLLFFLAAEPPFQVFFSLFLSLFLFRFF